MQIGITTALIISAVAVIYGFIGSISAMVSESRLEDANEENKELIRENAELTRKLYLYEFKENAGMRNRK